MKELTSKTVIGLRKDVVWKKVATELMLLHLESGDYYKLNETGGEFWKFVDGRKTVKEISSRAASVFGISQIAAENDAIGFFSTLDRYGLIDVR